MPHLLNKAASYLRSPHPVSAKDAGAPMMGLGTAVSGWLRV